MTQLPVLKDVKEIFEELAKLEPATRLENYQRMVGHRFGWLRAFRNKIK
jgi:hypothetical protein